MGAWGHGSFDNDAALDFLGEVEDAASVMSIVRHVAGASESDYIDADDASAVVVAAELVAASTGAPSAKLPPDARAWLQDNVGAFGKKDVDLTRRALQRVLRKSELQSLWGASSPWHEHVASLLDRLTLES